MTALRPAPFEFEEIRVAAFVFLLMLVPVASIITALQLFVPHVEVDRVVATTYSMTDAPSLSLYLLYLTSAIAHVTVSVLVIIFLNKNLHKNISAPKRAAISVALFCFVAIIVSLFLICDSLHPVLATLSHERIYNVLKHSHLFSQYFVEIPHIALGGRRVHGFYLFSVLPAGLIFLGLIVIVLTCFSVGRDVTFVSNSIKTRPTADRRRDLDARIRSFHNYFYVLSSVLATSTIATALFLRLPLTSIVAGGASDAFKELSGAMTICWGVTFSLTMLAMCFYPYFRIQRDLRSLLTDGRVTDDTELQLWLQDIQENYVIYTNLKSLISIFVPAVVGTLSRFI